MVEIIYTFTVISVLINLILVYKIYKTSKKTDTQDINYSEKSSMDKSSKQIDDCIALFLKFINDIIKYSEYLSLNMKDISAQSTILTDNSQLHIVDLEKTQTQIKDMHKLLSNNSKISENIKDTFKTVNDNVVERQKEL